MAISFWNLLGQAALLDWLFGKKNNTFAEQNPRNSASFYLCQEKRISALEDKIQKAQSRLEELQDEIDECLDQDSDEHFDKQRLIDDLQFDLLVIEDEAERIREEFDDDYEY